jgi:hypothetical protein
VYARAPSLSLHVALRRFAILSRSTAYVLQAESVQPTCAFFHGVRVFELVNMPMRITYVGGPMTKCFSCGKASHHTFRCCAEHRKAVCDVDCLVRAPLNSFGRTNKWGVRCCAKEVRQVLDIDLAEFSIPDSIAVGRADGRPRPFDGCPAAAYAADATADAAPLDAAQLTALSEQVPDGGEMDTMLHFSQRHVLRVRDLSAVRVEWKGLEAALYAAGRQLMPGVGLRAELCSVLVYRRGGLLLAASGLDGGAAARGDAGDAAGTCHGVRMVRPLAVFTGS